MAKFGIALGLGPRDFAGSNPVTPTKIAATSAQKPQRMFPCGFLSYDTETGGLILRAGKAFELFVKHILINIGFSEVSSDGIYVFDGAPGQMLQGLGEAHNADVLLDPPVQTPFYSRTRLLIECKDYKTKIGIGTVRSVLGLREDVNHFDIVDKNEQKDELSDKELEENIIMSSNAIKEEKLDYDTQKNGEVKKYLIIVLILLKSLKRMVFL